MVSSRVPGRRVPWIAFAAIGIWLAPTTVLACGMCGYSMFRMVFPFVDSAVVVFAIWRIGYGVWQLYYLRPSWKALLGWMLTRTLALCVLFFAFAAWAGVLLYLCGSYIHAAVLMAENKRRETVGPRARRIWVGLQAAALVGLVPLVVQSYREWTKYDDLERLARYAYTGTAVSQAGAVQYARDTEFDVERLRPLLLGEDRNARHVAFEILGARRNPDDVRRFQDILEQYDDPDFKPLESDHFWMASWIADVCGREVDTKAELREWLAATSVARSADETTTSPKHREPGP